MNVMVITVLLDHSGNTRGNSTSGSDSKFFAIRAMQRASFCRSVSRASMSASCSCTRSICWSGTKLRYTRSAQPSTRRSTLMIVTTLG